jgi:energy-dependent translational throttle protein EttA
VSKAVDGRVLFSGVSFSVPPGAIVGVIGANGVGKTTLLRIITGELPPDSGSVTMGATVIPSLVSQSREELSPTARVLDAVTGGADVIPCGGFDMPARAYLATFNLVGEMQTKLVRSLSGGERNRVHLARALSRRANVLLLDEPTNDLDVDTLRSLEAALADFPGAAVIVSHDRYFLNRVATHMLVFHGDGRVQWVEGDYSAYEALAERVAPANAAAGLATYLLPGAGGAPGANIGADVTAALKG